MFKKEREKGRSGWTTCSAVGKGSKWRIYGSDLGFLQCHFYHDIKNTLKDGSQNNAI